MRLKVYLKVKEGGDIMPKSPSILNTYIHRCLGKDNKYHDAKNDYCISTISNIKYNDDNKTVIVTNKSYFIISSLNKKFIKKIRNAITDRKFGIYRDIRVGEIEIINEEIVDGWNNFQTLSPFLIKIYQDKKNYTFLTLNDPDFENVVKDYLIKKLVKINPDLDLTDFKLNIKNSDKNRVCKVMLRNVKNLANRCRISIFCKKEVAELLYNIGIGQSTGAGFGTIYKIENAKLYN